ATGPARRPGAWAWGALGATLVLVATGAAWLWQSTQGPERAEAPARADASARADVAAVEAEGASGDPGASETRPAAPPTPPPLQQELAYGETRPRIDPPAGVDVGEREGLLRVRPGEVQEDVQVRVDGEPLDRLPAARALPEGRYEIEFRRGAESSYRYIYLQSGHTRIVEPPSPAK
ncbi:MAG: hypothetical protein ACODAG_05150, partial [Myxococcota bacterium]